MKFVHFLIRILFFVFVFIGVVTFWKGFDSGNWLTGWFNAASNSDSKHSVVLNEITSMGKLELVKYNFKDIVEEELVRQWLPNSKAILIVHGEAVGCIDLTKIQDSDVISKNDTLVISMPEPELCYFKIDHAKSKVHSTEYTFFEEGQLVNDAFKHAEAQIKESALEMGIIDQTKENARLILVPVLKNISDKPVVLHFPMNSTINMLK